MRVPPLYDRTGSANEVAYGLGAAGFPNKAKAPPFGGPLAGASVPVGSGPDQLEAFLAINLDQGGVDPDGEARVMQLDGR